MRKRVTILIILFIALFYLLGMVSAAGQPRTQFQVEQICEFRPKHCFTPSPGRIAILDKTICISVDSTSVKLAIINKTSQKANTLYELSDSTKYYGFFILREKEAVLDVYVLHKGLYTATFTFREQ